MTFEQRLKIIDFYHAHKHELTLDQMIQPLQEQGFPNICRATIQRCLKREAKDRAFVASGNPSCLNASRKAPYCPPEVEAQLVAWIKSKQAQGIQLPGAFICEKARMLCTDYGMPQEMQLKFSKSWLETFKGRYGLDLPKGIPWYAYGYVADLAPRQPGAGSTTEPRSSAIESRAE